MLTYQIHTIESAPEKSKPLLELFIEAVGFVPNLAGAIANSPVLAKSLLGLSVSASHDAVDGTPKLNPSRSYTILCDTT